MCDLRAHLARKRSRVKTSAYHRALGGDVCNPPACGNSSPPSSYALCLEVPAAACDWQEARRKAPGY